MVFYPPFECCFLSKRKKKFNVSHLVLVGFSTKTKEKKMLELVPKNAAKQETK